MKNFKNLFQLLLLASVLIVACNRTDDVIDIDNEEETSPPPERVDFLLLREEALDAVRQEAHFDAEEGISFTSELGVTLNISAGCLMLNGETVSGMVDLEFVEVFDRGRMLTTNTATMGTKPDGTKALLLSGGAFYINASQSGEPLDIGCHSMQLVVPTDITGGPDQEMILWKGHVDEDGNMLWDEADQNGDRLFVEGNQYYAFLESFGWTNVDRFHNDPRPKTTLQVKVPEGYTMENSGIYLSYDGEENALAQLDTYDSGTNTFSEHYGQVPIGLEMHIIFITEEDGLWRYAIKAATVAADDLYVIDLDDTTTATEQELLDAIEQLP